MKLPGLKRLVKEDFDSDQYALIDKLGFILNSGLEPLYLAANKNITITDNLNQQLQNITTKVNSAGSPINTLQIKYLLKTTCQGIHIINCTPTPTAAPWPTWEQTGAGVITISNIKGLASGTEYTLKLLIVGG